VQQLSDGTYRVYALVTVPENITRPGGVLDLSDVEKTRTTLLTEKKFFADWAPNLRKFIEKAEGPWRAWPLHYLDPEIFSPETGKASEAEAGAEEGGKATGWKRTSGVVLLGDAAHVGFPNGEGVNLAMLDAFELFKRLSAELGISSSGSGANDSEKEEDDAARIERAIIDYEAGMRTRAHQHITDGMMITDMMCQVEGAQRMIDMFKQFLEKPGES
jgi:2-polyprenyl-6-methoxyphenol hydroxylase-like FAD-dependent oxidoreductase